MDKPSYISENGLNMLLSSIHDSVSASHLDKIFHRAFRMDVIEKNNLYHTLHDVIKSNDSKQATTLIISYIEEIIKARGNSVQEMLSEGVTAVQPDGKKSPIFRRVG